MVVVKNKLLQTFLEMLRVLNHEVTYLVFEGADKAFRLGHFATDCGIARGIARTPALIIESGLKNTNRDYTLQAKHLYHDREEVTVCIICS